MLINSGIRFLRRRVLWALSFDHLVQAARPPADPRLTAVYDRSGLALIHIPKCAGTSIEQALYGHSVKHRSWRELRDMDPEGFARWTTFAVIRDPVDRFLSAFAYLATGGRNVYDREFARRMIGDRDVRAFALALADPEFRAQALAWFHLRPQADYVCDGDRVMVDRLFNFDRMDEVSAFIGAELPRLNVTSERLGRDRLSQEALDVLAKVYAGDMALLTSSGTPRPARSTRP